jgi:hypothetical protein
MSTLALIRLSAGQTSWTWVVWRGLTRGSIQSSCDAGMSCKTAAARWTEMAVYHRPSSPMGHALAAHRTGESLLRVGV